MNTPILPRLAAACGPAFAVVLIAAVGDGSHPFSPVRAAAGIAALTLAFPFIAYVGALLRTAEGPGGWLATTALIAGTAGIALKIGSAGPELAARQAGLAAGTPVRAALEQIGGALTVLSLYPLAILCAATAVVAFRTRVLPRWLAVLTAITAAGLAVNGADLATQVVPAMLLFLVWSLATSGYLLFTARSRVENARPAAAPAAA